MLPVNWWVNGCVSMAAATICVCVSVCVITAWLNEPISAGLVGGRGACGCNFSRVSKELFRRAQKCGCVCVRDRASRTVMPLCSKVCVKGEVQSTHIKMVINDLFLGLNHTHTHTNTHANKEEDLQTYSDENHKATSVTLCVCLCNYSLCNQANDCHATAQNPEEGNETAKNQCTRVGSFGGGRGTTGEAAARNDGTSGPSGENKQEVFLIFNA